MPQRNGSPASRRRACAADYPSTCESGGSGEAGSPAFVDVEGECAALAILEIAPDRPQMAIGNLKPLAKVERFGESLRMA